MPGTVHPDDSLLPEKAPKKSSTEKILFFTVCILVAIIVGLVVVVILFATKPSPENNVCNSEVCIERSLWITKAIDTNVDPCNDFYQYACGRWLNETALPSDKSSVGTFDGLIDDMNKMLNRSLSNRKVDSANPNANAQDKAAFAYQQCLASDTSNAETDVLALLNRILDGVGSCSILKPGWSAANFDQTVFMANVQEVTRDTFLSIGVLADLKNSSVNRLYIQQPGLNLQTKSQLLNPTEPYPTYRKFAIDVFTYLANVTNPTLSKDDLETQVDEMLEFERKIANVTFNADELRDRSKTYSLVPLSSVAAVFRSLIVQVVSQLVDITVSETEPVMFRLGPGFLDTYEPILTNAQPRELANYGIWSILRNELFAGLPPRVRELEIQLYNRLQGSNPPPRWKSCLNLFNLYLNFGIGRLYVDEHLDKAIKQDLTNQVEYIAQEFLDTSLAKNDWIDPDTTKEAINKLYAMEHEVAFPDYIVNDTSLNNFYKDTVFPSSGNVLFLDILHKATKGMSVRIMNNWVIRVADRKAWPSGPQTVNAFYSASKNAIYFPGGILYPPFYGRQLPRSMNFGGIGYVIGHEMSHGFDDLGRKFDKFGNMIEWWSNTSIASFTERANCMVNQYSQCCYPHLPPPNCINGQFTQGENIADNGGLRVSFEAYRKWKKTNKDTKLPGLTHFSDEQLFFLTSAHVWCLKETDQNLIRLMATDSHSTLPYRVNVVMQNLEQFSEVWQCRAGSKMNPTSKCRVW